MDIKTGKLPIQGTDMAGTPILTSLKATFLNGSR